MVKIRKKPPEGKYAWTVRVGDKGQIVIPKEARDVFHISPGDTLLLLGDAVQGIAIPPRTVTEKLFQNLLNVLPVPDDPDNE